MTIIFILGIIIGAITGVTAAICYAAAAVQKQNGKIQKAPEQPLDITPELAAIAYNVIRTYCKQRNNRCTGCRFIRECAHNVFGPAPKDWKEKEV